MHAHMKGKKTKIYPWKLQKKIGIWNSDLHDIYRILWRGRFDVTSHSQQAFGQGAFRQPIHLMLSEALCRRTLLTGVACICSRMLVISPLVQWIMLVLYWSASASKMRHSRKAADILTLRSILFPVQNSTEDEDFLLGIMVILNGWDVQTK